ncbi:MAG: hypothetical protein ACE5H7_07210 [Acidiferrobacterales bacterium]
MTNLLRVITANPVFKWLIWLLFAALFYKSGETFTVWVMEPERLQSGAEWMWIILFPLLVPVFFVVNRRLGCASGSCPTASGRIDTGHFPGH